MPCWYLRDLVTYFFNVAVAESRADDNKPELHHDDHRRKPLRCTITKEAAPAANSSTVMQCLKINILVYLQVSNQTGLFWH